MIGCVQINRTSGKLINTYIFNFYIMYLAKFYRVLSGTSRPFLVQEKNVFKY